MIPGSSSAQLFGAAGAAASGGSDAYVITRSLRFSSSDTSYLERTVSIYSNQQQWTWSGWVKRAALGTEQVIFTAGASTAGTRWSALRFQTDDSLSFINNGGGSTDINLVTSRLFRDPSAWYHIVVRANIQDEVSGNRISIYVNGQEETDFSTETQPSASTSTGINYNQIHNIGREAARTTYYCDLLLAEVNFVDGLALTADNFGRTNSTTGSWEPIDFSSAPNNGTTWSDYLTTDDGSFDASYPKTNAFNGDQTTRAICNTAVGGSSYIQFNSPTPLSGTLRVRCDNNNEVYNVSGGSSTLLGQNTSGSDNSFVDCGEVTGLTSLKILMVSGSRAGVSAIEVGGVILIDDFNKFTNGTFYSNFASGVSNIERMFDNNSGTWANVAAGDTVTFEPGTAIACTQLELWVDTTTPIRVDVNGGGYGSTFTTSGLQYIDITPGGGISSLTSLLIDAPSGGGGSGAGVRGIRINGITVLQDATIGRNSFSLKFDNNSYAAALGFDSANGNNWTVNNIVANSTSTGFKAVTYTGTGATQNISGLGFSPDLVWLKNRDAGTSHGLFDYVRGVNNYLKSDDTGAENAAGSKSDLLTTFGTDGFTLGANGSGGVNCNASATNYVAWCWDAGSTTETNNAGSIESQVRSSGYFSVVTYTGDGLAGATVGHGLSKAPKWCFIKNLDDTTNWISFVDGVTTQSSGAIFTNTTFNIGSKSGGVGNLDTSGAHTFSYGMDSLTNGSGKRYVAYLWADQPGVSAMGKYTGSGSSAVSVTTGFRPAFLLIKAISEANGQRWYMYDGTRGTGSERIFAEDATVHGSRTEVGIFSNGFQAIDTTPDSGSVNRATEYIYMAFASASDTEDIDSLLDSATNANADSDTGAGGEVSGNYATLNPLQKAWSNIGSGTLSNGNLDLVYAGGNWGGYKGTVGVSSGKWYYEVTNTGGTGNVQAGFTLSTVFEELNAGVFRYRNNGYKYNTTGTPGGTTWTAVGDVCGIALDLDNYTIDFYVNGSSAGSGFTSLPAATYLPEVIVEGTGARVSVNFGQRPFQSTAPTGFQPLTTALFVDPTVAKGSTATDATLYTGNGTSQVISGLGFSPDLVWIKQRNTSRDHCLCDIVRGPNLRLRSNSTFQETNESVVTAFNTNGFDIGSDAGVNQSSGTYVAWTWGGGSDYTDPTYNQSETWSTSLTAADGFYTPDNETADKAFDGRTTTYAAASITGTNNNTPLVFSKTITGITSMRIMFKGRLHLNGGSELASESSNGVWYTVSSPPSTLTQVDVYPYTQAAIGPRLYAIEINGKILVDTGVNTEGTITSTVRANVSTGFSVVTYKGTGSNATVGHGLNAAPQFIIAKTRDNAVNWIIYNGSLGTYDFLRFTTDPIDNSSTVWNTAPTSTVFGVGTANGVNQLNDDYVAYCWSAVEGYSAFGTYTAGTTPAFVYLGFRPKFVIVKGNGIGRAWGIYDSERAPYNVVTKGLRPEVDLQEFDTSARMDLLSNGFKIRADNASEPNVGSIAYVYAAFAENPFKTSRAR